MSEREGRTARILVVDGSYRISAQDRVASASGSFLLKQISDDQFVAQASNDSDWAYGLTARADVYSLFTFNRNDQNCTNLSSDERASLRAIIRGDRCYVENLRDLISLLRYLRRKFSLFDFRIHSAGNSTLETCWFVEPPPSMD